MELFLIPAQGLTLKNAKTSTAISFIFVLQYFIFQFKRIRKIMDGQ